MQASVDLDLPPMQAGRANQTHPSWLARTPPLGLRFLSRVGHTQASNVPHIAWAQEATHGATRHGKATSATCLVRTLHARLGLALPAHQLPRKRNGHTPAKSHATCKQHPCSLFLYILFFSFKIFPVYLKCDISCTCSNAHNHNTQRWWFDQNTLHYISD